MPGSTATFVGVSDEGREGIYVLPSDKIRGWASDAIANEYVDAGGVNTGGSGGNWGQDQPIYRLTQWTACKLPAKPGDMLIVVDPPNAVPPPNANPKDACYLDRTRAGATIGTYPSEPPGREKLVVTMPTLGGIAIIDAYRLLEWEMSPDGGTPAHAAGSYDPCPVERWIPLNVDLTGLSTVNPVPTFAGCGNPPATTPALACGSNGSGPARPSSAGTSGALSSSSASSSGTASSTSSFAASSNPTSSSSGSATGPSGGPYSLASCACPPGQPTFNAGCYPPTPAGMTYTTGTLYVADSQAPLIHVIDMPTPCEPLEVAPLLPTSAETPSRIVMTEHVSVSPTPTPDLHQYLYANDIEDFSVMVFDVGPDSTTRRPLIRSHPEWNPFEPRDRVKFGAPVKDVVVAHHDVPMFAPATGVAAEGVLCSPGIQFCQSTAANNIPCDVGTLYQTNTHTYTTGAGPTTLRGDFAFAALTSGKVAVIDIDDFDAPCRIPDPPDVLPLPHPETRLPDGPPDNLLQPRLARGLLQRRDALRASVRPLRGEQ